ncbi:uncharacterized protein VICG_00653 [Vittaforma corneae ATCC 50505]|uniref:Uncharacterized protein n=1 Tax=Vittaforma corneae (strain ATCC 50505) TaxID=993615 RepID=L2GNQ9_VITCO|nr:uncharacterized protein VICG_00653 [Vittaforma corneae ATCC 50505]ELA42254.1 hypothetical protein VICG_00653 [Vittaforma corneae ATCC 50505]
MFTSSSFPFKFASYRKNMASSKSRATLLTSFSCSHYPLVVMIGSMFEDQLVLCKKDSDDRLMVEDLAIECENHEMTLENFIDNFKKSDGLDFIVIRAPAYFLITRQREGKVKIYMTSSENYVEVFSDPEEFFGKYQEVNKNYSCIFDIDILGESSIEKNGKEAAGPDEVDETVIELEEPINDEQFNKIIEEDPNLRVIRIGKLKEDVLEFLRFPLEAMSTDKLSKILVAADDSAYSYIEILGKTKIAGVRKENEIVWFVEVSCGPSEEHEYIKELNTLFLPFLGHEDGESEA